MGNFFKFDGSHTNRRLVGEVSQTSQTSQIEAVESNNNSKDLQEEEICEGGSFEANPPFVESIMNEMADLILSLLEKYEFSRVPFSFCVIVPGN